MRDACAYRLGRAESGGNRKTRKFGNNSGLDCRGARFGCWLLSYMRSLLLLLHTPSGPHRLLLELIFAPKGCLAKDSRRARGGQTRAFLESAECRRQCSSDMHLLLLIAFNCPVLAAKTPSWLDMVGRGWTWLGCTALPWKQTPPCMKRVHTKPTKPTKSTTIHHNPPQPRNRVCDEAPSPQSFFFI